MTWDVVPGDDMDDSLNPDEPGVIDLLRSLCEPGYAGELAGEQVAVAAFAAAVKEKEMASRADKGPRRLFSAVRGAKLAAAAMVGSLVMGGVAAAAATGSLPGPLQDIAHSLGAPGTSSDDPSADPTESESSAPSASPSGLPASANGNGPSTFAVCSFVVRPTNGAAADHGQGAWTQAYARVNAAAVGQGQSVLDYCTGLLAAEHVDGKPSSTHGPHNGDPNGDGNGNGKQGSNPAGSQGSQGTKGSGKGSSSARSTASAHASSGAAGSTGHPGSGSAASSGRS